MKNTIHSLCRAAAVIVLAAATGHAADLFAPNSNFNWTNENAWNTNTATWTNGDSAFFGDITLGRTAQLSNAVTAQNLTFSNTNNTWTVSGTGGSITLDGTLTKSGAGTLLIQTSVPLGGNGSVVIDGGEVQLINNTNTFSGGITLNGGTLRVGNANGTGTPQTAGSLGAGTLIINGGTIFQNQGNGRVQAVAAVISNNFSFNSVPAGGLTIGSTNGTRLVDVGNASRTITVSQSADGSGADSYFGLRDLTNSAGGAIVKEGAGVLRVQGANFNGTVTASAGSVEISGAIGAASYRMGSNSLLRVLNNDLPAAGSTLSLSNATLVNNDTLQNQRKSSFATLQVSGTNSFFVGSGLTIQSSGTAVSGFTVRSNGVLGGDGLLRTAGFLQLYTNAGPITNSINAGVTTLLNLSNSSVTLSAGGSIRPGSSSLLDLSIGTLSFGALTWNGETSATAQMAFNLGTTNASDRVVLSGALSKGGGTNFIFDFVGTAAAGTFTLVEYASTDFVVEDFAYTNLASGFSGTFQTNATSLQFVVTSSGSPYNNWLTNYPSLTGTNTNTTADPDGDGFDNFTEFAFDGNPTIGTPAFATAANSATNATFTFVARLEALTNYVVMSTTNLSTGPWVTNGVTVTNAADQSGVLLTNDYVRRGFTVPVSASQFFRVKAELVP